MKAAVCHRYGSPGVVSVGDAPKPGPEWHPRTRGTRHLPSR
jgi:hypothetical protein